MALNSIERMNFDSARAMALRRRRRMLAAAAAAAAAAAFLCFVVNPFGRDSATDQRHYSECVGEILSEKGLSSASALPPSLALDFICSKGANDDSRSHPRYPRPYSLQFGNRYWQVLNTSLLKHQEEVLFLRSAFLDDRKGLDSPAVRIPAMVNRFKELENSYKCIFWHEDGGVEEAAAEVATMRRGLSYRQNFIKNYPFLVSCDLGDSKAPAAVSLVEDDDDDDADPASNVLRLEDNRPNRRRKGRLAACVKPSWIVGREYSARLAEWLELQFALGVEKVFLSPFHLDGDAERLLAHYQSTGRVEVLPPFSLSSRITMSFRDNVKVQDHLEMIRVFHEGLIYTDCVLRNVHRFEYLALLDTDEVFFPLAEDDDLPDLISALEAEHARDPVPPTDFTFNAFYFLDSMTNSTEVIEPYEHISSHRMRSSELPEQYEQGKSIVNVSAVLTAWTHRSTSCVGATASSSSCRRVWIDPDRARMAHYRKWCRTEHVGDADCRDLVDGAVADGAVDRYAGDVGRRTRRTLEEVGLLNSKTNDST